MRIVAKLYSSLFMIISILALGILIAAVITIKNGGMGSVILIMPHFWLFVALYALLPILFCIGLSLRSHAALSSRAYVAVGMICLLPWLGGMTGMMMTMTTIAPRVEQHVLQMNLINRVAERMGTLPSAPAQPAVPVAPQ